MTSTRKRSGDFIKSTIISGVLVILPLGLVALIVLKIVSMVEPLAMPFVERLPHELRFPTIIASLFLILACLIAGLLAQTRAGRGAGNFLEGVILNRIPGYSIVRSLTRRIGNVEESEKFAPALAEIEEALVPAFIVEEHADGQYTVFVPSAPTPAVGSIYIIARERAYRRRSFPEERHMRLKLGGWCRRPFACDAPPRAEGCTTISRRERRPYALQKKTPS